MTFVDSQDTTGFAGIGGSANVAPSAGEAGSPIAADGTLSVFRGHVGSAVGGGGVVLTLFKNGSSTALTCTIASGSTACVDASDTVAVVAGDLVAVRIQNSSGLLREVRWTAELGT